MSSGKLTPRCFQELRISPVMCCRRCWILPMSETGRDPTVIYRVVNASMIGILERSEPHGNCGFRYERDFVHLKIVLTHG